LSETLSPSPIPRSDSTGSDPLHALRITDHAFPISPLSPLAGSSSIPAQPHDHVPVFDRYGAWVEWLPREGPNSEPKCRNFTGFENRRKQTLCWINLGDPYPTTDPTPASQVAVINPEGRILYWANQPAQNPIAPFYNAEPLRCRSWNTIVAWVAMAEEPYIDPPCGALVG